MMERYICIHGHFYQPPRENPWLEAIEYQDSAYPYHDWNERITVECYAPNTASRILDDQNRIVRILNTYSKISFNFGPTLLAWLETHAKETYDAILAADRESVERYSGHGSALAQAYNHMIMPLATRADQRTQVLWGIRDFEHRFRRKPEGMWLPETAVDLETLDVLAEAGIAYTILAPHQAARVRRIGAKEWREVGGGRIDPTRPYRQELPSGRSIDLFFYDGPVSRAVAFEDLLRDGARFANRLAGAFSEDREWPQLAHIATDGETYGHHRRHGEMALAYALEHIEARKLARRTNYGEYLERHPPTHEVEIVENSSWSCAHGIERWRSYCGCRTGGEPGWNQRWRKPLREALDWLRDTLAPLFDEHGRAFFEDPWAARDGYIEVILDRSVDNVDGFLERRAGRALEEHETVRALKLLELQRHAMLMYTSCGWFFDELSGIETTQVIQYAGRAVQLAQELFGDGIESRFLDLLERAKSNIPEHRDGRTIYENFVKPAAVDLEKVAAHYAVSSLFAPYSERSQVYCYTVDLEDSLSRKAGNAKLGAGRVRVTSEITRESAVLNFTVIHFGDHNLSGGVRAHSGEEAYQALMRGIEAAFSRADFPEVIRLLDKHFHPSTYSLESLFRDEQRRVLNMVLEPALAEAEAGYERIFRHHSPLMRFLAELEMPLPNALDMAAEFVLNTTLSRVFSAQSLDFNRIRGLLDEARLYRVPLDSAGLGYALEGTLDWLANRFRDQPQDLELLKQIEGATDLHHALPFEINLWRTQNVYYDILQRIYPDVKRSVENGDGARREWVEHFEALGRKLGIALT
jgi:alpha-amylase/alpha-mannosidase (GH57 family)